MPQTQRIVIKVAMNGKRSRPKMFEIVGKVPGVQSITIIGKDENHVEVVGHGIDSVDLTRLLSKKVGTSELVSLAPVEHGGNGRPVQNPVWGYSTHQNLSGYEPSHGYKVSNQHPYRYEPSHGYEVSNQHLYGYGSGHGYEVSKQYPYGYGPGHGYEVNKQNPYAYQKSYQNHYAAPGSGYETKTLYVDGRGHWSSNENSDWCSIM